MRASSFGSTSLLVAYLLAGVSAPAAAADTYPSKPITMIVGAPAGGPVDVRARQLAQKLQDSMGQPVVIENRPGAANTIGTAQVAKAKPDGHTLVFGHTGSFSFAPSLFTKLPYDPVRDFAPIALVYRFPHYLYVPADSPIRSVKELIGAAKAQPGGITYGSSGIGSPQHIEMELLKHMAGVDLMHVPYKGSAPMITDLIGRHIEVAFDNYVPGMEQVKAGKLRVLATTSAKRLTASPDIATLAESGVPDYDVRLWLGVFAPAGTPRDVVVRLNSEINRALVLPDVRKSILETGGDIELLTPDQFAALVREELVKGEELVKISGARLE